MGARNETRQAMKPNFTPALSVILVTPQSYETCRKTISFLRKQTAREQLELVIVAPSCAELNPVERELEEFGAFQIVEVGAMISTGQSMAEGARCARAPFVIYGEEHSYPEPRWAEILIHAHAGPYAVVGCAIGNANPKTLTS